MADSKPVRSKPKKKKIPEGITPCAGKFRATAIIKGRKECLGSFGTLKEAIAAQELVNGN